MGMKKGNIMLYYILVYSIFQSEYIRDITIKGFSLLTKVRQPLNLSGIINMKGNFGYLQEYQNLEKNFTLMDDVIIFQNFSGLVYTLDFKLINQYL